MICDVSIVPLGQAKNLLDDTAKLLNSEWQRSHQARLVSLEKSLNVNSLPCSLILIIDEIKVVGHVRICLALNNTKSCILESLVITHNLRGKGLGKYLLKAAEEYAIKLGYTTIYLSTLDKIDFYIRMGYVKCEPITNIGAHTNLLEKINFLTKKTFGISQISKTHNRNPLQDVIH